jgi:hypothetical protein
MESIRILRCTRRHFSSDKDDNTSVPIVRFRKAILRNEFCAFPPQRDEGLNLCLC